MSQITVITASLPDRGELLRQAMESVRRQTLAPADHLIAIDYQRAGGARARNTLVAATTTPWVQILDDDDLLMPEHLQRLAQMADDTGADVAYSWCTVEGDDRFDLYNRPYDREQLRNTSIVSHNALVRTELLLDLGGWIEEPGYDWKLWNRAADAGARFACLEERTWHYRLNPEWAHESRPWNAR
jgi:glycosyltransferase involved in cell wall biosynthesis